jgi:hypothetical protein
MICTDCGQPILPVVAMDIDGTLGDYHTQLIRFAEQYTGVTVPEVEWYRGDMRMKHWAMAAFGMDERSWKDLKLAYRQGSMKRSMPAFYGAAELCQAIIESGAELWLTTTRPYMRLDNVDPDTRFWLERQGIKFDGLLYDEHKYEKLSTLVDPDRVVAVVDDLPEQVLEAKRVFGPDVPIHRRSRFNQSAGMKYESTT